ncbi:MAG: sigma-70 family RNA polymerase sigma factor [Jeotgalicoccus sp.]
MTVNDKITSYEPMIHSIVQQLNILYDKDEYMQIGRIAVFEAINKFDVSKTACSESQFVYTIIRQRLIDEIRKVSRYQERNTIMEDGGQEGTGASDSYNLENTAEKVLNIREYQWFSHALSGYSLQETAEVLGVSVSPAKNIRRSARVKLQVCFSY